MYLKSLFYELEASGKVKSNQGGSCFVLSKYLELGEVSLPPEVGLNSRAQGSQAVIGVHDDVDERVEEGAKGFVATWNYKM